MRSFVYSELGILGAQRRKRVFNIDCPVVRAQTSDQIDPGRYAANFRVRVESGRGFLQRTCLLLTQVGPSATPLKLLLELASRENA
jgi:hypothetical protein